MGFLRLVVSLKVVEYPAQQQQRYLLIVTTLVYLGRDWKRLSNPILSEHTGGAFTKRVITLVYKYT